MPILIVTTEESGVDKYSQELAERLDVSRLLVLGTCLSKRFFGYQSLSEMNMILSTCQTRTSLGFASYVRNLMSSPYMM
jgi:hypothetical protein